MRIHGALARKLAADGDGSGVHFTREEALALEQIAYREISHLFPAPLTTKRSGCVCHLCDCTVDQSDGGSSACTIHGEFANGCPEHRAGART